MAENSATESTISNIAIEDTGGFDVPNGHHCSVVHKVLESEFLILRTEENKLFFMDLKDFTVIKEDLIESEGCCNMSSNKIMTAVKIGNQLSIYQNGSFERIRVLPGTESNLTCCLLSPFSNLIVVNEENKKPFVEKVCEETKTMNTIATMSDHAHFYQEMILFLQEDSFIYADWKTKSLFIMDIQEDNKERKLCEIGREIWAICKCKNTSEIWIGTGIITEDPYGPFLLLFDLDEECVKKSVLLETLDFGVCEVLDFDSRLVIFDVFGALCQVEKRDLDKCEDSLEPVRISNESICSIASFGRSLIVVKFNSKTKLHIINVDKN